MADSPVPKQGWAVKGTVSTSTEKTDLTIPEHGQCITMTDYCDTFGSPIDGTSAVSFIKNFYKLFKIYRTPLPVPVAEPRREPKTMFEKLIDDMSEPELRAFSHESRKVHHQLFKLNYGMTIDKNMALKFLSQPKCEGLRFYLCSEGTPQQHLSLVAVGVDENGCDLNYTWPDTGYSADTTPLNSLLVEYVTPPNPPTMETLDSLHTTGPEALEDEKLKDIYNRFVLLNMAGVTMKTKKENATT
jgi:hypothetical protein